MPQCRVAATSPEVLLDAPRRQRLDRGHIAALTGLRGFAALAVVLTHAAGATDYVFVGLQTYGPIALFTLSGFLLFQPWTKWMLGQSSRPDIKTFFRRRIFRIFPAYLVTFLLVALVYRASRPVHADGWLQSATLTQIYSPAGLRPGMDHVWSLGTELSWYVALPVIGLLASLLVRRRGIRPSVVMALVLATAVITTVGWHYYFTFQIEDLSGKLTRPYWLPGFIVCFIGGATIAHLMLSERFGLSRRRPLQLVVRHPWLTLMALVAAGAVANSPLGGDWGYVAASFSERSVRFTFTTAMALLLLAVVAASGARGPVARVFAMPWLVAIGRWSYGLYLWHLPVRDILMETFSVPSGAFGLVLWFGIQLAIAIPLGAATYAWVERPVLEWSRRDEASMGKRKTASQIDVASGSATSTETQSGADR